MPGDSSTARSGLSFGSFSWISLSDSTRTSRRFEVPLSDRRAGTSRIPVAATLENDTWRTASLSLFTSNLRDHKTVPERLKVLACLRFRPLSVQDVSPGLAAGGRSR